MNENRKRRICPYLTPRQPCPSPGLVDCHIHTDWGLVPCPVIIVKRSSNPEFVEGGREEEE